MVLAIFQIFQLATESSQETYYHPRPGLAHPFLFSMVLFLVAGPARPPDVPGIVNSFQYCRILFERQVDGGPLLDVHVSIERCNPLPEVYSLKNLSILCFRFIFICIYLDLSRPPSFLLHSLVPYIQDEKNNSSSELSNVSELRNRATMYKVIGDRIGRRRGGKSRMFQRGSSASKETRVSFPNSELFGEFIGAACAASDGENGGGK